MSPVLVIIDATEPPERPVSPGKEGPLQAGARTSKASLKDARTRASYAILNSDLNYLVPGRDVLSRRFQPVDGDLLLRGRYSLFGTSSLR